MRCNFKTLGTAMLATGPLVINFGTYPLSWWLGFLFTTLGPFMMAIESRQPKPKRKPKKRHVNHT
jgi:hypothetical protein